MQGNDCYKCQNIFLHCTHKCFLVDVPHLTCAEALQHSSALCKTFNTPLLTMDDKIYIPKKEKDCII